MKQAKWAMALSVLTIAGCVLFTSAMRDEGVMSQSGDTTIVNTKTIGGKVRGFKGSTPVRIYIRKNHVVKVEALPNRESPNFFNRAKAVLDSWNGKPVGKASKLKVDAVSGATYSSDALIKNVQLGLEYYKTKK